MWFTAGLFVGVAIYGAAKGRMTATVIAVVVLAVMLGVAAKRKRAPTQAASSAEP
jgi:hypothetical protein